MGHLGSILTHDANTDPSFVTNRYAKDLMKDRFYTWLETGGWCFWAPSLPGAFILPPALLPKWRTGGTIAENVRFGLSILAWGTFVRTVTVPAHNLVSQLGLSRLALPQLRNAGPESQ